MRTMEMSDKAWHLRLVRFFHSNYKPESVCGYFWKILWTMCLSVATAFGAFLVITILAAPLISLLTYLIMGASVFSIGAVITGTILWTVIGATICRVKWEERQAELEMMREFGEPKDEKIGLIGEFWNNIREKTCTRIVLK